MPFWGLFVFSIIMVFLQLENASKRYCGATVKPGTANLPVFADRVIRSGIGITEAAQVVPTPAVPGRPPASPPAALGHSSHSSNQKYVSWWYLLQTQ